MTRRTTWKVERVRADVATLHGLGVPDPAERTLRWCEPTDHALVLGRAQSQDAVVQSFDTSIVRRSSGGGAVLIAPHDMVWFDVIVPAGDVLWSQDVMQAFMWLGDALRDTFAALGMNTVVFDGPHVARAGLESVCFAGTGPGELLLQDLRKAVGISQRRTRAGALFQCSVYLRHDASRMAQMLGLDGRADDIEAAIATFPDLDPATLEAAFETALRSR